MPDTFAQSALDGTSALSVVPESRLVVFRRRSIFDLTSEELDRVKTLAKMFAAAKTLKVINLGDNNNQRLDEGEYFLVILQGLALGIDPMVAPNFFNVIYGKVTINTQGMMALIHQSGLLEEFKVHLEPGKYAEVTMKRRGIPDAYTTRFSMEDAQKMNLLGKDNWKKQPDTMMINRVESKGARVMFSDVINGLSTTEEIQDSYEMPSPPSLKELPPPQEPPQLTLVEKSSSPVGEHWTANQETRNAFLAFLKENGFAGEEENKAIMKRLHPDKPITRWGETPYSFEELKSKILATVSTWSDENIAEFTEQIWSAYNRPPSDFLEVLGKTDMAQFPTMDAAATAFLGVAKAQKWGMVAHGGTYTKGQYIEWDVPARIRQYGRTTTFKEMVGKDFYDLNQFENLKPGDKFVVQPPLLVQWELKGDANKSEYAIATSYAELDYVDEMPWDEPPPEA